MFFLCAACRLCAGTRVAEASGAHVCVFVHAVTFLIEQL